MSRFAKGNLPSDIETKTVSASPIWVVQLIREVGFASSNSEARRFVEQGSVTFGDGKITDPQAQLDIDGEVVLKVGKRRVCKVKAG